VRWLLALCIAALGLAEEWARFRGPNGSGTSESTGLPTELGAKNLLWRVGVPLGRSSPIVVKDRIYVTALEADKLLTLALDRHTGRMIWRRDINRDHTNKIYVGNDTATPTPASDGENIYVFFPDLGLISFDAAGEERWRIQLGPFDSFYGLSSSPVVHGNTVALVCDQRKGSFVISSDKDSGRVRWRVERKVASTEGFSTPAIYMEPGRKPQLIVTGAYRVDAYDLESGENLWWIGKQGVYPVSSPVFFGAMVIAVGIGSDTTKYEPFDSLLQQFDTNKDARLSREEWSKHPLKDHFGWLDFNNDGFITRGEWDQKKKEGMTEYGVTGNRIAGTGDRTETNVVWRYKKSFSQVITPLIYRDVLYLVTDGGVITTLNPKTGNVYKAGRTKDAIDQYFASPVGADGKVFLVSHSGRITVLKADPQWDVLSVSDLNETAQATPAIADGRIYIRTHKALYSFGTMR
jgi:outer membrane protein assembly factor BamB